MIPGIFGGNDCFKRFMGDVSDAVAQAGAAVSGCVRVLASAMRALSGSSDGSDGCSVAVILLEVVDHADSGCSKILALDESLCWNDCERLGDCCCC